MPGPKVPTDGFSRDPFRVCSVAASLLECPGLSAIWWLQQGTVLCVLQELVRTYWWSLLFRKYDI